MLKRADVVFNDRNSSVSGLVRNISDEGAMFIVDSSQELPSHVSLRFANGEEFECNVVRTRDGVEFGLKFCNPSQFDVSKTRRNIDAIYQIAKNLSPFELHRMLQAADFFGDEEIERIANAYVDAYHDMVEALQEKILPKQ